LCFYPTAIIIKAWPTMTLDSTTLIFVLVSTSGLMALMFLVAFWRENVPEARLCTAMLLTQMVTWALYGARGTWRHDAGLGLCHRCRLPLSADQGAAL
jgi:hypothetical protein